MRFLDIPAEHFAVRVKSTDGSTLERHFRTASAAAVQDVTPSSVPSAFDLSVGDETVSVTPTKESLARQLNSELGQGRAMLAELTSPAPDGSAELRLAFFSGVRLEMGRVEIGVDEYVENVCHRIDRNAARDIYAWLRERCTFSRDGQTFFFVTAGPAVERDLQAESDDLEVTGGAPDEAVPRDDGDVDTDSYDQAPASEADRPPVAPTIANSFCVTGSDMRFVATATSLHDGESIFVATKLTARRNSADRAVRLARGTLEFRDWTRTGKIQLRARAQLSALTADESSYLNKWDEFGDLEGEILLRQARKIGAIRFGEPVQNRDGTVSVRIIEATQVARDSLSSGQLTELEEVDQVPEYVADPEVTFADFARGLAQDTRTGTQYIEVASYDRETRTLRLKAENMPAAGTLVMSLAGDRAQIKRRDSARRAILEGRSANPQLGLLIEEKGEITSLRSPQKVRPLTAFVRKKAFNNAPTVRQESAIEVALNTPDIAVIQGPPGTGKTTVIAAILERLNEIAAKEGAIHPGQVLLSGFQHDAVENLIERVSLNGIPVPKFGRRSGSRVDDLNAFERRLEEWCEGIAAELRDRNPQIARLQQEVAIVDLYKQYLRTPTHALAAALTDRIGAVDAAVLGNKLSQRAVQLSKRLATEERAKSAEARYLAAAQRIRVRAESFADDGPDRAEDALVDLEEVLNEQQASLLAKAGAWRLDRGTPPFLRELAGVKAALLYQLTAPPEFAIEKPSDVVLDLADAAIRQVQKKGFSATDKKSAALAEFLAELENNPFGMVDAVSQYSYAFSATVQQSVNKEMQRRKGISTDATGESLEYEYVIIDEAARVSPRDLMIPMAQGKKIILVGDHRQLPHIIDEEVARLMEEGEANIDEAEWLKTSMFQYLFSERVRALENKDGITRRVTLDKQFRMHPELGDFVSRNFYERFDPTERFESGLPAEVFAHHLPGTDNRPAMWLDVPGGRGREKRSGTSWTRQAEVEELARKLKEWIESPEGADLTYGVISFYKAQAELIRTELRRRLGPSLDTDRKIRVGTVDSFQGMEFDVVFLSIVRTPQSSELRDRSRERQARRLFGHLALYNRLNVSMSRQKRLLIAVGDAALVHSDLAAEFIPGLVDFHELATAPHSSSRSDTAGRRPAGPERSPHAPPNRGDSQASGVFSRLFGSSRSHDQGQG